MKVYKDEDANVALLEGKKIGVIGYGNQGRSQALNMRDSSLEVVVADGHETARLEAERDGFSLVSVNELSKSCDVIFILLPDDQIPAVYNEEIRPAIEGRQKTLVFASGYVVNFGLITFPQTTDVVLLAPRMIGRGIRTLFVQGSGFPTLIAVEQDASGNAFNELLALAKAIGGTRGGAFTSSFREEAIIDLFFEQTGELYAFRTMFEVLTKAGFSPEVVLLDMYGSGELVESYTAVRDIGLWKQLKVHSMASQYGQEVVALKEYKVEEARKSYQNILDSIMDGSFSAEYQKESETGFAKLKQLRKENEVHPMQLAEDAVYSALGRRTAK